MKALRCVLSLRLRGHPPVFNSYPIPTLSTGGGWSMRYGHLTENGITATEITSAKHLAIVATCSCCNAPTDE